MSADINTLKAQMEPVEKELYELYQVRDTINQVVGFCGPSVVDQVSYNELCEKITRYENLLLKAFCIIALKGAYEKDAQKR